VRSSSPVTRGRTARTSHLVPFTFPYFEWPSTAGRDDQGSCRRESTSTIEAIGNEQPTKIGAELVRNASRATALNSSSGQTMTRMAHLDAGYGAARIGYQPYPGQAQLKPRRLQLLDWSRWCLPRSPARPPRPDGGPRNNTTIVTGDARTGPVRCRSRSPPAPPSASSWTPHSSASRRVLPHQVAQPLAGRRPAAGSHLVSFHSDNERGKRGARRRRFGLTPGPGRWGRSPGPDGASSVRAGRGRRASRPEPEGS